MSDGSAINTVPLAEIGFGAGGSAPRGFFTLGQQVLFVASTPGLGAELYAVPLRVFGGAQAQRVGFPCPNQNGLFPDLFEDGLPVVGNPSFRILLNNLRPSGFGMLALGDTRTLLNLTSRCAWFVGGNTIWVGFTATPLGNVFVPFPIPDVPDLIGASLIMQAVALEPQSTLPFPVTLTNGVEFVLGR